MFRCFAILVLLCAIAVPHADAAPQSKKKKALPKRSRPKTVKTEIPLQETPKEKKEDPFLQRLRISYFGAFTSPTFRDIGRNHWRNAAVSPQYGNIRNQDTAPANIWNQLSFNYQYSPKLGFIINPRFTLHLAHPVDRKFPQQRGLMVLEDFLVGVQGVVLTSEDRKFNLWIRPGVLLPISSPTRHGTNQEFGPVTFMPELSYLPTYDFNKTWQVGVFGIVRSWVYEDRFNPSRFRFYTAPFVRYAIDDKTRLQVYYEHMLENGLRWESINNKRPNFRDVWQNVMIGVNRDVNAKLNVYPFMGVFVNDTPFSSESLWLGTWVSYQFR